MCCVQLPFAWLATRICDCAPVFPSMKKLCPVGWTAMAEALNVAGKSSRGTALVSPACQLTTWLPALSWVRMTASAPVGKMSKSTTVVPAGRLSCEGVEGEGVTLSSAVVKVEDAEGACANPGSARTGRVRNSANARICAWVIRASADWIQAILEHLPPNSGGNSEFGLSCPPQRLPGARTARTLNSS